ncbi:MAG TPA: hypothetical protein ENJ77_01185, partial [Candidatus Moranbacteria bacterium]|nr:hypothetical protein [Candidatus Moranbacteria bacterium]
MKFFKNLTLSLFSMLLLVVSACAAAKEEFSLCLASAGSPAEVVKVEKRLGRFDCLKRYRNLAALSPAEIPDAYSKDVGRFLDAGYEVFLVVTLPGMTLADINAGKADERVVALAEAIAADGREVTLVLLHEANGGTYSWSVRDGATPADFVSAWRRLVGLIREVAPNARFDLNYNRVSAYRKGNDTPESRVADFAAYFPGGDWVDSVSISGFNRCGTSRWHRRWLSFGEVIDLAYRKLSSFVPKEIPIRIAETGTTSLCGGDKARWYINMGFDSGEKRWPRLAGLTLFLEKISAGKASNERVIHWAPETEYQWRALAA